jgi:hypothetical protein
LAELGRAPSPGERVADHTALIAAVLPTARARLHRVAGEIAELTAGEGAPVVPVHGDLYEAQLLVRQARIVGVLDIDGTGAGHRHDDFANMVGHLSVLAKARRSHRCERVGTEWMATIDRTGWFDPARFRAEVAAVVLGLATGSFRVQDKEWQQRTLDRLDLVDAWLDSARRAAGVVAAGIRAG